MAVPLAAEFALTPEDRQAMQLVLSQGTFGRPYVLPPGVAPERVAVLRKAFMAAMADPALIADAKRTDLDLEAMSGSDLQDLIASLYALPSGIIERAKQSLTDKPVN
jgi:tripartite-type tricarboxylate transporter receptor subunit TctC